jgi:hypothetical protein
MEEKREELSQELACCQTSKQEGGHIVNEKSWMSVRDPETWLLQKLGGFSILGKQLSTSHTIRRLRRSTVSAGLGTVGGQRGASRKGKGEVVNMAWPIIQQPWAGWIDPCVDCFGGTREVEVSNEGFKGGTDSAGRTCTLRGSDVD